MRVMCHIERMISFDVGGVLVPSLRATCTLCQYRTWSRTTDPTVAQCLEAMGRSCPRSAGNEYVAADGSEVRP